VPSEHNTVAAVLLTPGKMYVAPPAEGELIQPFPGYPSIRCIDGHNAFCIPYSALQKDCKGVAAAASFTCIFSNGAQQLVTTVEVPFKCPIEKANILEDIHHHNIVNGGKSGQAIQV
jgi:hypothetical protein